MKNFKADERHTLNTKTCRVARAKLGLTGRDLAALIEVPHQTWYAYEVGRRACPVTVRKRAAKALRVTQKSLLA